MLNRFASLLIASVLGAAASAALAQPASAPVAKAAGPADAAQAMGFVQSYAAATRERHMIARWGDAICVEVSGLASDQAAVVKARVEAVAGAVGVDAQPAGCRPNVDIRFSIKPQRTLDDVIVHRSWLLGDATSDTRTVLSATLPIQAWYETNGVEFAAIGTEMLKVLVRDQELVPGQPPQLQSVPPVGMTTPPAPRLQARQFLNVMVIVDLRRTKDKSLGLISDYVAMLALSQPRSLDRCNVRPSVTDLFAGACPGRGAPTGLTPTDGAYLAALYAADPVGRVFVSQQDDIVAHMVRRPIAAAQRAILSDPGPAGRPRAALAPPPSAFRFPLQ
jgi:hypothetical protein